MHKIANHVLAGFLALAFIPPALMKLLGNPELVENFARWGFPGWFIIATGLAELTGAALIAIPRARAFGAALLVAVMIGALGTHVVAGELNQVVAPLILGLLSTAAFWINRHTLSWLPGAYPVASKAA